MKAHLDFEAHYEIGVEAQRLPDHAFRVDEYLPPQGVLGYTSRLGDALLTISYRDTPSWTGVFQAGGGGISGVYTTPSPSHVCVIVSGQAYWINAAAPKQYHVIDSTPVKIVHPVEHLGRLVFIDFSTVVGYGHHGFLWRTEHLSWDGIGRTSIEGTILRGEAWDSPANRHVPFSMNLATGEWQGGSSPQAYGC